MPNRGETSRMCTALSTEVTKGQDAEMMATDRNVVWSSRTEEKSQRRRMTFDGEESLSEIDITDTDSVVRRRSALLQIMTINSQGDRQSRQGSTHTG